VSVFRGLSQPLRLIVCAGQNAVKPSYTCRVTISCAKLHFLGKNRFRHIVDVVFAKRKSETIGCVVLECKRCFPSFSFLR